MWEKHGKTALNDNFSVTKDHRLFLASCQNGTWKKKQLRNPNWQYLIGQSSSEMSNLSFESWDRSGGFRKHSNRTLSGFIPASCWRVNPPDCEASVQIPTKYPHGTYLISPSLTSFFLKKAAVEGHFCSKSLAHPSFLTETDFENSQSAASVPSTLITRSTWTLGTGKHGELRSAEKFPVEHTMDSGGKYGMSQLETWNMAI